MYFDVCNNLTVSTDIPGIDSECDYPKIKNTGCLSIKCKRRGKCVVVKDDETLKQINSKSIIDKYF